jgi:hypothetical protein
MTHVPDTRVRCGKWRSVLVTSGRLRLLDSELPVKAIKESRSPLRFAQGSHVSSICFSHGNSPMVGMRPGSPPDAGGKFVSACRVHVAWSSRE